ncbi:MAG: Universal stress protein UspA [Deltaproteobacteria bacterium]|nr:Universal stress protein UspA [Deltaproteobacteria bacterium]
MNLPRNILVPIDFSEYSEQALDYAVALADKLDAKVHVLNVIGVPALGVPELGIALTASVIDGLVREHQEAIDKLAAPRRATGRIGEVILRTGDARDVILQAREEVEADMIVMGTHGRRGISRALLGSVAESVVRMAPCPVLTIRAPKGKHR